MTSRIQLVGLRRSLAGNHSGKPSEAGLIPTPPLSWSVLGSFRKDLRDTIRARPGQFDVTKPEAVAS